MIHIHTSLIPFQALCIFRDEDMSFNFTYSQWQPGRSEDENSTSQSHAFTTSAVRKPIIHSRIYLHHPPLLSSAKGFYSSSKSPKTQPCSPFHFQQDPLTCPQTHNSRPSRLSTSFSTPKCAPSISTDARNANTAGSKSTPHAEREKDSAPVPHSKSQVV